MPFRAHNSRPVTIQKRLKFCRGTEAEILELCRDKFHWKTNREIDRVEELFDDGLIFVHLNGHVTTKREWIATMRSGTFVYRSIRGRAAAIQHPPQDCTRPLRIKNRFSTPSIRKNLRVPA